MCKCVCKCVCVCVCVERERGVAVVVVVCARACKRVGGCIAVCAGGGSALSATYGE